MVVEPRTTGATVGRLHPSYVVEIVDGVHGYRYISTHLGQPHSSSLNCPRIQRAANTHVSNKHSRVRSDDVNRFDGVNIPRITPMSQKRAYSPEPATLGATPSGRGKLKRRESSSSHPGRSRYVASRGIAILVDGGVARPGMNRRKRQNGLEDRAKE